MDCEQNFDPETFTCKNVYQGSRSNTNLIQGLNSTDAKILLYTK